jgi:hypothetical protein
MKCGLWQHNVLQWVSHGCCLRTLLLSAAMHSVEYELPMLRRHTMMYANPPSKLFLGLNHLAPALPLHRVCS